MVTFADGTHGFPKNEGYFQDCKLMRKKPCQDVVQRAQKVALMARTQELYDVENASILRSPRLRRNPICLGGFPTILAGRQETSVPKRFFYSVGRRVGTGRGLDLAQH